MKNSKLYFYLSIAAIVLNFITGFGIVVSIILLVLIPGEKNRILQYFDGSSEDQAEELRDLSNAKTVSIVNIILTIVLSFVAIVLFFFFGVTFFSFGW